MRRLSRQLLRSLALALVVVIATPAELLVAEAADAAPAAHRAARQDRMAQAVFDHLNHERSLHGLRALTMNPRLALSAHRHNLRMAQANELSHQLPGEAYFSTRITKAGYDWLWAGENIAWNSRMTRAGVVRLQQLMYHEKPPNDGHRRNILNAHYRNVGVDVYLDSTHHKVWLTTDFGKRRTSG
jgi:uncharacterized protein YkwD